MKVIKFTTQNCSSASVFVDVAKIFNVGIECFIVSSSDSSSYRIHHMNLVMEGNLSGESHYAIHAKIENSKDIDFIMALMVRLS